MNEPVKPQPEATGHGLTQSDGSVEPTSDNAPAAAPKTGEDAALKDLAEPEARLATAGDYLPELKREYSAAAAAEVVPSAFDFLNRNMGGWRAGLHLLAGEPGSGKTAFTLSNAAAAAQAGFPVLYLSFDVHSEYLVMRLLCQQADLDCRKMMDGVLDDAALDAAMASQAEIFSRITVIEADPELPDKKVEDIARQLIAASQRDRVLVIVDYLQIWAAGSRQFTEFRHEIGKLMTAKRRLAICLDSPVLAVSSQNRIHQGEAILTSLEGTSDLEYSADSITFLVNVERPASQGSYTHPDELITKSRSISLNLRKNRFGETGSRMVKFLPSSGAFNEETVRRPLTS